MASNKKNERGVLGSKQLAKDDQYYWDSYSHLSIHQEMIQDRVRTEAYRNAILGNRSLFEGKTVLDLGAGTGILSFFCAQAGAARVYAVEASDIADQAALIVQHNKMDHIIKVIKSKGEDIGPAIIPPKSVDIIVSEWMGYFLLYESMFDSVAHVRDRFLKDDGLMFPSRARMYLAAMSDMKSYNDAVGFWENVYGIDMSCLVPYAKKCAFDEPIVDAFDPQGIISNSIIFKDFDTKTVTNAEIDAFEVPFSLVVNDNDWFNGFVSWFDVIFPAAPGTQPVVLHTTPEETGTHWAQTIFYTLSPFKVRKGDIVSGTIAVKKSTELERLLDISFTYSVNGVEYKHKFSLR
jgi:predicted RNA methylase